MNPWLGRLSDHSPRLSTLNKFLSYLKRNEAEIIQIHEIKCLSKSKNLGSQVFQMGNTVLHLELRVVFRGIEMRIVKQASNNTQLTTNKFNKRL